MSVYVGKKKNKPPKTWFMQENLEPSRNELVFFSYFSRQASKITRKKLVYSSMILCFDYINS